MLQEAGGRSEGKEPESEHVESPGIEERSCGTGRTEGKISYVRSGRSKRAERRQGVDETFLLWRNCAETSSL